MKKLLWILPLIGVVALVWWLIDLKNAPPEVRFVTVARETLVDTLNTNGKVEPVEWASVRAERAGRLEQLNVQRGQKVAAGYVIARLDSTEAQNALQAAEARVAQVRGEINSLAKGGRSAELAEIDATIARLRVEKGAIEKELAATERLAAKKAATAYEVATLRDRIALLDEQIRGMQSRRGSLVTEGDRAVLEGRLQEAQASVALARDRIAQGIIRTPIAGTVYHVEPRVGAILNPGDLIANIGKVEMLRVSVFVDEPELGRVAVGMPVSITWDAKPGATWSGSVERLPVQIVALGSRQVGEVLVTISNENGELPPGANINATIRSQVAPNALVIPKECLRREDGQSGVFALEGDNVRWRPVQVGISNVTHAQIVSGVKEGDRVAAATDIPLRDKSPVQPAVDEAGR